MGMGKKYSVEAPLGVSRRAIQRLGLAATLEHSAVDHDAGFAGFEDVARAGDFAAGSADDFYVHGQLSDQDCTTGFKRLRTSGVNVRRISSTASLGESVMRPKPSSSFLKTPCATRCRPQIWRPFQNLLPKRMTGKGPIFLHWISVAASKSSSKVPSPPGMTTK